MRDIALSMTSKILTGSLLLVLCLSLPAKAEYQADGDVVTDTETGLMWMQSDDGTTRDWQSALAYCQELEHQGYSDWRLPNLNELESLVDYGRINPAINPVFDSHLGFYWSSSPYAGNSAYAWGVGFSNGEAYGLNKNRTRYVRCVRGGP